MNVTRKDYEDLTVDPREVARYARASIKDDSTKKLIDSTVKDSLKILRGQAVYVKLDLKTVGDVCDFGVFSVKSKNLAKNLGDCREVIFFAATLGLEIDREIRILTHKSPARALVLNAVGAAAIENVADKLSSDIRAKYEKKLRPRFSAGYGDLPLEIQGEILNILDAPRSIGLSLTEGGVMTPTKSRTAFIGLEDNEF